MSPVQEVVYIAIEISFADFDLHVLTSCGSSATVVNVPAIIPNNVVPFIVNYFNIYASECLNI